VAAQWKSLRLALEWPAFDSPPELEFLFMQEKLGCTA